MARRFALAAFSTLLCATMVGAELETLEHHLIQQHVVCADHGQLVHIGGHGHHHGDHHGNHQADRPAEDGDPGFRAATAASGGHGHLHCSVVAFYRVGSLDEQPAVQSGELGAEEVLSPRQASFVASIPVLLLAPKSSPPVAA